MDHCAVCTTIASPVPRTQDTSRCINNTTLSHPSHRLDIEVALKDYLFNNATDDISTLALWEAHKAVIRDRLIQQAASLKRDPKILLNNLEANFNAYHAAFQSTPNATTNARLDKVLTDSADKLIHNCQHILYLMANKPDTPMACTLRAIHHPKTSICLKTTHDTYTSNSVTILEVFCFNLAKLYSLTQDFNLGNANTFFSRLALPTLIQEQQDLLKRPITDLEVTVAIKALKPHKRPEPDVFSAAYYKQFVPILTPMLTRAFNSVLTGHSFRSETLISIISMLPNPKSDFSSWTNHRPISLLNLDIKLLAKIPETIMTKPALYQLVQPATMLDEPSYSRKQLRLDTSQLASYPLTLGKRSTLSLGQIYNTLSSPEVLRTTS